MIQKWLSRAVCAAAGLAILALAGCGQGAARPAAPSGDEARYLAAADPDQLWVGAGWDGMESAAIAHGAPAIRSGDDLILRLSKAKPLTLTTDEAACDEEEENPACARYRLLFDLPWLGVIVVGKESFDINDIWLYDRATGHATGMTALPKFSPDGRKFFVRKVFSDPRAQGELAIWRRKGDQAVVEWRQPMPQIHPSDTPFPVDPKVKILGWQGNEISLEFSDGAKQTWPGKLSFDGRDWTLDQTPPAALLGN